jgi:hypothetical protein
MRTIISIMACGIASIALGYFLASVWRKVLAPKKHLNNDKWYYARGILPHRLLLTVEQFDESRARSARVRREQWEIRSLRIRLALSIALWLPKALLSLLFAAFSLLAAPLVALFAGDNGWLPKWLWWFQTPDNPVDGEPFWIASHPNRYTRRVGWLWRNAGYGFDWNVLSPKIPALFTFASRGNPDTGNMPLVNGWCFRIVTAPSRFLPVWQFYCVRAYSATRCVRMNFGYKIWANPQPGQVAQIVFSPSLTKSYTR